MLWTSAYVRALYFVLCAPLAIQGERIERTQALACSVSPTRIYSGRQKLHKAKVWGKCWTALRSCTRAECGRVLKRVAQSQSVQQSVGKVFEVLDSVAELYWSRMWQSIERVAQRQSVRQEPGAVEARAAFSLWDTFDNMWQTFDNLWDSFDNNWDILKTE